MAARVQHTLHGVNARVRTSTPKRPLQWRIDCPAPGFGDPVSPHIDHLTAGSYRLGRNCCPPHAQKLCYHLRRNLIGDQRRLGDATRFGVRQKLKNAATVVVERDRAQLWLRARGGQSCLDSIGWQQRQRHQSERACTWQNCT